MIKLFLTETFSQIGPACQRGKTYKGEKGLVSKGMEFQDVKEDVVFVNVACGGVVDEVAMKQVLDGDKIRAITLDVYEQESLEEFALIDHKKLFIWEQLRSRPGKVPNLRPFQY